MVLGNTDKIHMPGGGSMKNGGRSTAIFMPFASAFLGNFLAAFLLGGKHQPLIVLLAQFPAALEEPVLQAIVVTAAQSTVVGAQHFFLAAQLLQGAGEEGLDLLGGKGRLVLR